MPRTWITAVTTVVLLTVLGSSPAEAGDVVAPVTVSAYTGHISHETTTSVVAGDRVTVVGVSVTDGEPAADVPLELWAKAYGGAWGRLASATSDSVGRVYVDRSPSTTTTFEWRFPGDSVSEPSSSNPVTVKVATRIGLRVADRTIARGRHLVVSGRTRPAKPGATVRLRYDRPTGHFLLASASVRSDGSYRISKVMRTRGSYSLYVTVTARNGNLAGRSGHTGVSVR